MRGGLVSRVRAHLRAHVARGSRLRLGLSGGVDSIVLLDVLARLAPRAGITLEALHVDHGLNPQSRAWARFCRAACEARDVPCRVVRVSVSRSNSIERAARDARYAALLATRAEWVALAHNADDQAETVLLQLLRGAGVKGLAAMALVRTGARPDSAPGPSIFRPLLDTPRGEIERYARRRKLAWIDDDSNADTRFTRNWLRNDVLPRVRERFPAYRASLTRAARNAAEAAELSEELARIDLSGTSVEGGVQVALLRSLTPARAKNVLRYLIAARGSRLPDAASLEEALRQALAARIDARVAVELGDCELRRAGGAIYLVDNAPLPGPVCVTWRGEPRIALPALGGVLAMVPRRSRGLSAARLARAPVTIRGRQGGERLQPDPKRPRRTVKNLLQELRLPAWQRERLPFIYCGGTLVCVPGVGIDWRFGAAPGEAGFEPAWQPVVNP